jgi:hypothetical protein
VQTRYSVIVSDLRTGQQVCGLSVIDFDRVIANGEGPEVMLRLANEVRVYERVRGMMDG